MRRIWKSSLVAVLCLLAGCASFQLSDFSEVRLGMDRSDVIDNIGSPLSTQKRGELNIWTYRLPSETHQVTLKEVHFREDRVVYAGDPVDWPVRPKRGKASEGEAPGVESLSAADDFQPVQTSPAESDSSQK